MIGWESQVASGDLVFDVGAGQGDRTDLLAARGARVICVEPHPDRARALKLRFGAPAAGAVTVVDMGLSNRTARVPTSLPGVAIEVTTLDELIRAFGVPRYCHIEVGGDPEAILDGLSAGQPRPIALLSFEFRAAKAGSVARALDRLARLGYRSFNLRLAPEAGLAPDGWTDARGLVERIRRGEAPSLRGDIFARRDPVAGYAVSILRQPGNIHSECFREMAETVHGGLVALGHDAVLSERTDVPGRTNIVFGSNLIANFDAPHRFAPGSILYNLEQIYDGSPWLTPELLAAFRAHTVWDYSPANIAALARHGIAARHAPVGYVPQLTRIPACAEQDIDVLFIGSIAERRLTILQALQERGAKVMAIYGLYGPPRDAFIARAKIVLNIHFHAAKVFEIVRVSYLLANRCFVVSETGSDPDAERRLGAGVAFCEYDRLIETCLAYLADPPARRAVAARGFEIMSAWREAELLRPLVGAAAGGCAATGV
jgi:hypothetical protein